MGGKHNCQRSSFQPFQPPLPAARGGHGGACPAPPPRRIDSLECTRYPRAVICRATSRGPPQRSRLHEVPRVIPTPEQLEEISQLGEGTLGILGAPGTLPFAALLLSLSTRQRTLLVE